jgi:acetyltransferase
VATAACRDGTRLTVRPIRPEDEPLLIAFHRTLSEESVQMRYMQGMKVDTRTAHARLLRICFPDYDREIALVAEHQSSEGGERTVVAVGRLSRDRVARSEAEFSLLVADPWQGRGVGSQVLSRLIEVARREGIGRIYADILEVNIRMQRLCARLGFTVGESDGGVVRAVFSGPTNV